jgi:branched-chain amino acid transport system substrate-binding protein
MGSFLKQRCGRVSLLSLFALAVFSSVALVQAAPGVSNTHIVFGQSCVLDGPAKALGQGMRAGILAAFGEINRAGGVAGRKLDLTTLDDGYEPALALRNTRELIDTNSVFALAGYVGTPTMRECLPKILETGIPCIGPFTGAGFLRRPAYTNIINVRASYAQETEMWIHYLTHDQITHQLKTPAPRIAIFFQDDSFGRSGLSGVRNALNKRNLHLAARGTYARNLTAVHSALFTIRRAEPDAVVMVGAYRPCAEFIKLSRTLGPVNVKRPEPKYVNISFVGAQALATELGESSEGVLVTQVVPLPWDASHKLIANYQRQLQAIGSGEEIGFVSLEGYIVGRLIVDALKRVDGDLTRQAFLNAFYEDHPFQVDGVEYRFSFGDNQGSDHVYLTRMNKEGKFDVILSSDVDLSREIAIPTKKVANQTEEAAN